MGSPRRFSAVHRQIDSAVQRRVFPSASLLVAQEGQPLIHQAYGRGELDTLYDLASLTKVLTTTAVVMQLTAEGRLTPADKVVRWLPELDRPLTRTLRIWHLLAHASGLPAWLPFFQQVAHLPPSRRRHRVRQLVARTPLESRPGSKTLYSDLGFILLDWAIERCCGRRLDRLAEQRIHGPLGLTRTGFVDLRRPGAVEALCQRYSVAPTERCPWRGRRLWGEVHDDNCHAMGGVSGHAGLFSTAYEVHRILTELVAAFQGGPSLFDGQVVRRFLKRHPLAGSTRVLGWDTPAAAGSSSGTYFGPRAVGHLGFTGTSIWVDPERSLWVVLLTNRVFYGREPNRLKPLRPRLHDRILAAVQRGR